MKKQLDIQEFDMVSMLLYQVHVVYSTGLNTFNMV